MVGIIYFRIVENIVEETKSAEESEKTHSKPTVKGRIS